MIASSIMMSRALAPIETVIANWRGFVMARDSLRRLIAVFARIGTEPPRTVLPKPERESAGGKCRRTSPEGEKR